MAPGLNILLHPLGAKLSPRIFPNHEQPFAVPGLTISMLKLLSIAWSVWKIAGKRFGPGGGFAAAVAAVTAYVVLKRLLRNSNADIEPYVDTIL